MRAISTLTILTPKLHLREHDGRRTYIVWCPACGHAHSFDCWPGAGRPDGPGWTFDGNIEQPTFTPSLRIFISRDGKEQTLCHFNLTRGKLHYCSDMSVPHSLSGQVVDMEPIPEGYGT